MHYRSLWESNEEMKRPRRCCCWQLPDNGWWKLLVPSLRIHLFQLTKDFFYGKEVRKAQPFSGMLWLTWNFRHLPLKFVFCQWLKGLQHFLVTWSMITRFISGESWFKKFLLVIKITMINSDFKIFSLKSFPLGSKDRTREDGGNWTDMSTWTNFLFQRDLGEWRVTSTDSKRDSWTILFCVMNFQQLHCFQNVRNVFEWLWFGFDRTWSSTRIDSPKTVFAGLYIDLCQL